MKIYLETKDKDNHRIVFVGSNGKLVYSGEWTRRKDSAQRSCERLMLALKVPTCEIFKALNAIQERPYMPGAFAPNRGPKKKAVKSTTKKKPAYFHDQ